MLGRLQFLSQQQQDKQKLLGQAHSSSQISTMELKHRWTEKNYIKIRLIYSSVAEPEPPL